MQWPHTPSVEGGNVLVVRGFAFVGCGDAAARVQRWEDVVGVEIRAVQTQRFCLQSLSAWMPFEATVTGLRPRTYRVRVGVAGLEERAEGAVTITAP